MKNLLGIILNLLAIPCVGQKISDLPANSAPFNFTGRTVMAFDERYEGIRGTPNFLENFGSGKVELKKKEVYSIVLINYDAYTDNLVVKNEKSDGIFQVRKDLVNSFTLKNDTEEFFFVKKGIQGKPTFLLALLPDSVPLYCKIEKKIKKADIGGAYNISEQRYDEFIIENTYYTERNRELIEIKKNKKGILQAFPEHEELLSEYLKKNKIDFDNYEQLKAVMLYINTLG